jgi:hypothetical protein
MGFKGGIRIKSKWIRFNLIHFDSTDSKELESPSYPGLLTRYEFHDFLAYSPVEHWQEEFREVQPDKTTIFVWR